MAQVPDYSGLEAQWQIDCHNWNANITATNRRQPALSNPPSFLKLFHDGYDTYKDLKADLDAATKSAGFLTTARRSEPNRVVLVCSRGAQKPSTATTNNASTIKTGCKWRALAHATKQTAGKWTLVVQEEKHTHHGPQEVPEAQRGWVQLSAEHHDFLTRTANDPSLAKPKKLEAALRREYPEIQLGSNTTKNWLQDFRKKQQGIYTPTQATLDWLEKEGYWYKWTADEENNITGIFWCGRQQIEWIRERRFSRNVSLDCTYSTNNKKMPYFQGTTVTHTKKILPLFQGIVDNEKEEGFRWLLEQVHELLRQCGNDPPSLFITDYDTALINALKHEFPRSRHQLCIFHMNMNVVLHIKKKWRKPAAAATSATGNATGGDEAEDLEEGDEDLASLNASARNAPTMPSRVPDNIPYTRTALFDLLKIMEYSTDRETYDTAWRRLQETFSDQTAILNYLKTYYVDEKEEIVAKWAAHSTCKTLNFGLRTTSSTESMHRQVKLQLGHGVGNLLYLTKAAHEALESVARDFRLEEARQKTAALQKFNGQKWLGKLPLQITRNALELLDATHKHAIRMLRKQTPRRRCTASDCRCPIYTQYGIICANRLATREEESRPLEKIDIHEDHWLDRDLSLKNPLLAVLSPKKVTATKGRPRDTSTFGGDEDGIFEGRGKAVMGNKTTSNTTGLGSRAGDKTRATTASVQRINSAFEWNDSTLESLDQEDTLSSNAQQNAVHRDQQLAARLTKQSTRRPPKRKRPSGITASSGTTSAASTPSSTRPRAKKQHTGATRSINQLPQVILTAEDFVGGDDGEEGTQEEITVHTH